MAEPTPIDALKLAVQNQSLIHQQNFICPCEACAAARRALAEVEAVYAERDRLRGFVQSISVGDLQYFQDSAESTIAWIQKRALEALEAAP